MVIKKKSHDLEEEEEEKDDSINIVFNKGLRAILSVLILLTALLSLISVIWLMIYRCCDSLFFILARFMHMLLIPVLIVIGFNITMDLRYIFGGMIIAVNALMIDIFFQIFNYLFSFAFIPFSLSVSFLVASSLATLFLFIFSILSDERSKYKSDINDNINGEYWMGFFSQIGTVLASFGILFVILWYSSPNLIVIWLLAFPIYITSITLRYADRKMLATMVAGILSGTAFLASLLSLTFTPPSTSLIYIFFVNILGIPGMEIFDNYLRIVSYIIFGFGVLNYFIQFIFSIYLAFRYNTQDGQIKHSLIRLFSEAKKRTKSHLK